MLVPVEAKITEYLHIKAAKAGIPLNGTFELTPLCNMKCKMCYVQMSETEQRSIRPLRTAKEWISIGKQWREKGLLYLLLTGGEPFSRPDFREIYEELHKLGLILSINSNATLITEETIEWLCKAPPSRINVTLYGASNATYERLCGNPTGFTSAINAIRMLKDAGIEVKINCSVTPDNVDDLEEIFKFCNEQKLVLQATSYMFPPCRKDLAMTGRNFRFTPEDAAYYQAKIDSMFLGDELFLHKYDTMEIPRMEHQDDCILCEEGESIWCRAGKCSFWMTWEGKVLACGMLADDNAPDVFEVGIDEVWKYVRNYVKDIRLPVKCRSCSQKELCKSCAAMVYTESGSFSEAPEYRCRMSETYPDACKKIAEEIRRKGE